MWETFLKEIIKNWPFYAGLFLLFVALVVAILVLVINNVRFGKFEEDLAQTVNSSRIFVINIRTGQVTYFNVLTPNKVKKITLSRFYQQFPNTQQNKVINWINLVAEGAENAPDYLETDATVGKSRKSYFSMLEVDSVDIEKGIIHLQSYLLKYLSSGRGSYNPEHHGLSTSKQYQEAMANSNKRRGVSIVFRFAYRRIQEKENPIDPLTFNQLKNVLFPFAANRRMLLQLDKNELMLVDFHIPGKPDGLRLAKDCIMAINRYLSLNGHTSRMDVRAGIVEHRLFPGDAETVLEQAKRTATIAFSDTQPVIFYERGSEARANLEDANSFRTEVERIIQDNKIAVSFRPIYAVKEGKVFGYFAKADPVNTYFDSMDDLHDYAARTDDDRALFSTVARNTIPTYIAQNQNPDAKLFYPVRVEDRGHMLLIFAKLAGAKTTHTVFLFKETDIRAHFDAAAPDAIIDDMREIKAKGYEVGLYLEEGELLLAPNIYNAFDYFVWSLRFAGTATGMDAKIRSQMHSLVEKLLKYKRPIIATDIEGWDSIELLVRSDMRYISSEFFAPFDPMITPPPSKSVKKIRDIKR